MRDFLQVDNRRKCVELFEYVVRPRILGELRHRPALVRGVTEHDRARWTTRGASRRELVRFKGPLLRRGAILGLADSLDAEGALLHYALSAHGDIRIQLPVERLGERVLRPCRLTVAEPVEVANLVRTIVGAVARADAAVIDLNVQPVGRMIGRINRADRLARRISAVLTHHWDEASVEIGTTILSAFVVALDADPCHFTTAQNVRAESRAVGANLSDLPIRAHGRNCILVIARTYAPPTN